MKISYPIFKLQSGHDHIAKSTIFTSRGYNSINRQSFYHSCVCMSSNVGKYLYEVSRRYLNSF